MAAVFEVRLFWKSRFWMDGDRGFLNYLIEDPQNYQSKDWRLIYHYTSPYRSSFHFLYLLQPWYLNRWLKERLSMTRATDKQIASEKHLLTQFRWRVHAELQCDRSWILGTDPTLCKNCWMEHVSFIQPVLLQDCY